MTEKPFGYLLTMHAKPGRGEDLRTLMATANSEAAAVESWLVGIEDDDPDSLIGLELYRNENAAARHDQDPAVAAVQAEVRDLLAEPPTRTSIRLIATSLPVVRT